MSKTVLRNGRCATLATILLWAAAPATAQAASSSCRASAARSSGSQLSTFEPVVANPGTTPCMSESHELVGAASEDGTSVTDPRAATEAVAGTFSATASDDSAAFSGAPGISVGHVAVKQVESCVGGINVASGSSSVDGLMLAGMPVSLVGGQSIDETIAGVHVATNQLSGDTRRALVLEFGGSTYVLGEATAGGDACATLSAGSGEAPAGSGGNKAGSGTGAGGGGEHANPVGGGSSAGLPIAFSSELSGALADRVAASRLALQCTRHEITLIDVLQRGKRVEMLGAAETRLAGRIVTITLLATHKRVATAVVQSDGFFGTTAALPRPGIRRTNKARYQASIGKLHSGDLKLTRRMLVQSISSHAGKVTIAGRVIRPLAQPIAAIVIKRRTSCTSTVIVKRVRPRPNGTFTVTVRAPTAAHAAVYVATTAVRQSDRSRKTYPTSTLPRVVVVH